ncbi:Z1 domain-containing protein [Schaalia cardiffensis]|uniref:Z1 domain-containing protein n=1 Tax=Schaalia cardiffensis TaxID=181487 RepID=UPI0018E8EB07|nr:Z1 domain-containing protein [Schaalia cardiffensis]MBJ2329798.1 Z1 domain-containing protein [Schaalia cardiffensis]
MSQDDYDKAFERAMRSMTGEPDDLQRLINTMLWKSSKTINTDELAELILDADSNSPAKTAFILALYRWDDSEDTTWTDGTAPATRERRSRILTLLGIPREDHNAINEAFPVRAEENAYILDPEWAPWYDEARRSEHHFYWDAYKNVLSKKLPPASVAAIDVSTTQIVGRLADPTSETPYQSRGLVVGHVQSGKTANFTGVIAKAIDAGYRLIIVLTGTIELLRAQTQRRLDMELIGRENIIGGMDPANPDHMIDIDYASNDDADWIAGRFVSHGARFTDAGVPEIRRLTRAKDDYKYLKAGLDALDFRKGHELRRPEKPMWTPENLHETDVRIAVVKKNTRVLEKLVRDLGRIHASLGEIPTLIIDDEADQASVNTLNPKKATDVQERTAINKKISELLGELKRAQYIGYTATPFANVFVSPEDSEDIFPRDFIVSLAAPEEYRGGAAYHDFEELTDEEKKDPSISNERAFVRDLMAVTPEDAEEELGRAIDSFVLTGAIKLWRAEEQPGLVKRFRHHTMLVHESVRTQDHADLAATITRIWKEHGYGSPAANARLRRLFDEDFKIVSSARDWEQGLLLLPDSFDEVAPFVGEVLDRVTPEGVADPVVVVNGDKEQQYRQVDFESDDVWRILVGGTKLSRGFTLEGLTITYFKRRALQADSLMQMGRWFGYRKGYSDLVRLYMARNIQKSGKSYDLYEAFGAIMKDEEDFRAQLKIFSQLDERGIPKVKPIQVPPLVFQQLPWLKPTSTTKMYNAELSMQGIGGRLQDFPRQPERGDGSINRKHFELVKGWFDDGLFGDTEEFEYYDAQRRKEASFKGRIAIVPAEGMLEVLEGFDWTQNYDFEPNATMIRQAMAEEKLEDWAVLLPELTKTTFKVVDGLTIPVLKRTRRSGSRGGFSGSSFRQRDAIEMIAGNPRVNSIGCASHYHRLTRGALLLTFAADPVEGHERDPKLLPEVVSAEDIATIFSYAISYLAAPKPRIAFRAKKKNHGSEAIVDAD